MDLSLRNSDPIIGLKEQKVSNRKHQKLAMEKKRRNRFNKLLNELKFMVLKGMGRDNVRFAKLEKTEILDLTYRYMKYLNFRLNKRCSSDAQIECRTAQKELVDFITKYEGEKNTTSKALTPPPSPSPTPSPPPLVQQRPATNSTPYTFTHPAMIPVTLPYVIEGQISPNNLDNIGTADVIRNPLASISVVNPQTMSAHLIKNEYISYGYCVSGYPDKFAQAIEDQHFYSPPLSKDPSPKVWRPWTQWC